MTNSGNYMESNYEKLAERLDKIEDSVEEIKHGLFGNKNTKQTGAFDRLDIHQERIEKLEQVVSNGKWLLIGLSASSGVGILKLIETLFK